VSGLQPEVIIIGAGLGGCVAAHALTPNHNVTVIELSPEDDIQGRLVDVARPAGAYPHIGSGLGGTTALWHNALIEIDEGVFHSHWPFPKSELAPWYEASYPLLCGVGRSQIMSVAEATLRSYRKLGVTADVFQPQYVPNKRRNVWQSLGLADRVKLVRGEAFGFQTEGQTVRSVLVKTNAGEEKVKGDFFIVAAGGLGTPIVLEGLAAAAPVPALQNAGRLYEDHPIGFVGQATISVPLYRFWNLAAPSGTLRFLSVIRHKGLDFSFQLRPSALSLREDRGIRMGSVITKLRNQMWNPLHWIRLLGYWDDVMDIISIKTGIRIPTNHFSLFMQAGQVMSNERAVSGAVHPMSGRRLIHRKWVLSQEYRTTAQEAVDRFAHHLHPIARSVTIVPGWFESLATGAHHSGTARMCHEPSEGVCDPNGRIHGLKNIYIADGSAIPGSGVANTGLTIAALALRLADHLQRRTGAAQAAV
jgi:hypothetical protein